MHTSNESKATRGPAVCPDWNGNDNAEIPPMGRFSLSDFSHVVTRAPFKNALKLTSNTSQMFLMYHDKVIQQPKEMKPRAQSPTFVPHLRGSKLIKTPQWL